MDEQRVINELRDVIVRSSNGAFVAFLLVMAVLLLILWRVW
jgi:predicted negative regulator of RcsB-dependent stress response